MIDPDRDRLAADRMLRKALGYAPDPYGWRHTLLTDLKDATGAIVALSAEVTHQWDPRQAEVRLFLDTGWPEPRQERMFARYQTEGANAVDPFRAALFASRSDVTVGTISRLVGPAYFDSDVYRDYVAATGIGDMLCCVTQVGTGDLWNIVTCLRRRTDGPFSDADIALFREVGRALRCIIGLDLSDASDPVGALTQRRRAALAAMLNGLSERAAAQALGVSPHTFHSHVRDLYDHFGVNSRAELQALFYGRGRLHESALPGSGPRHNRIRRTGAPMARPWQRTPRALPSHRRK